jgi:hypothetical protein
LLLNFLIGIYCYNLEMIVHLYNATRISGPYGPLILALAKGWLATLTRGFASLNLILGALPPSHPLMVGTETHANRQKGGDRSTYEQTNGWGKKNIRTNKRMGTEPHMNKKMGGDRITYE